MIKAFFKWIVIGIIAAIIFMLALENILPKSELTSAFIGLISLVILVLSLVLAIIQVKLIARPPSVDTNLNKFERFIFSVNSLLGNFSSGYQSGKENVGGADSLSGIVDSSNKSKKSAAVQTVSSQLKSNNYYENILIDIRKHEDKIAELKTKIDDAKRYREERLHLHDEINRRMVEVYDEEIIKFSAEIRVFEKEMDELVQRKRQEEDRAKRN